MRTNTYVKWFWERALGFTTLERMSIKKFYQQIRLKEPILFGYVHSFGRGRFILTPLPWIYQVTLICYNYTEKNPPDGSYIRVEGHWERRMISKYPLSFEDVFIVENWQEESEEIERYKPRINFKDFIDILFSCWENLSDDVKHASALNIISSPTILNKIGGINSTFFSAKRTIRLSVKFVNFLKKTAAPLTVPKRTVIINSKKVSLVYPVELLISTGRLTKQTEKYLLRKETPKVRTEVSVVIGSPKTASEIIMEYPEKFTIVKHTDFPVLIDADAHKVRDPEFIDPDALEFMLLAHTLKPQISQEIMENAVKEIQSYFVKAIEDFDVMNKAPVLLSMLNLNFEGRPLSIVRIARGLARANFAERLSFNDILSVFHKQYFPLIQEWIYRIEQESSLVRNAGVRVSLLSSEMRKVLAFITRNDEGVVREKILEKFPEYKNLFTLEQRVVKPLLEWGFIYETVNKRLKAVV